MTYIFNSDGQKSLLFHWQQLMSQFLGKRYPYKTKTEVDSIIRNTLGAKSEEWELQSIREMGFEKLVIPATIFTNTDSRQDKFIIDSKQILFRIEQIASFTSENFFEELDVGDLYRLTQITEIQSTRDRDFVNDKIRKIYEKNFTEKLKIYKQIQETHTFIQSNEQIVERGDTERIDFFGVTIIFTRFQMGINPIYSYDTPITKIFSDKIEIHFFVERVV